MTTRWRKCRKGEEFFTADKDEIRYLKDSRHFVQVKNIRGKTGKKPSR